VTPPPAVLLAADDRDTREFLAGALRDLGYPVTVVADGADAWTAYQQVHVPLVLLDVDVARLGGLDGCRRIHEADRARRKEQIETILQQAQRIAEVVKRVGALRNPMSVEYLPGMTMIDLGTTGGELRETPPSARKRSQ
jgi:CheY-like chemotaxis protein